MLLTSADFSAWNGGTGIYRPSAVADAMVLAQAKAEEWLNTGLEPTQYTDTFPWPQIAALGNQFGQNNKVELTRVRLISIDSVVGEWSDGTGTPQTEAITSFTIINNRLSILRVIDPFRCWCQGPIGRCPERVSVTYTAGFSALESAAGTMIGTQLRAIVCNAALGFLISATGLNADGNVFKPSYTAAGFSESRQMAELGGAELLMNEHLQMAFNLARSLRVKRHPRMQ